MLQSPVLEIENLEIRGPAGVLVRDVSLRVDAGEILCVVGESGCGKTLTALSVLDLLPAGLSLAHGTIRFEGRDVSGSDLRRRLRGNGVGIIFQEPATALNPVYTVGFQIREMLHGVPRKKADGVMEGLLRSAGLDPSVAGKYPHELSGGMKQRAMMAMALAGNPRLLLCDEPTTALDPTVGALILSQLRDLAARGLSVMLITHDFHAVRRMTGNMAVLYAGVVMEEGPIESVMSSARHPYTHALLEALPRPGRPPSSIPGQVPPPGMRPPGCPFFNRCSRAQNICENTLPPLDGEKGHRFRCHSPMQPATLF